MWLSGDVSELLLAATECGSQACFWEWQLCGFILSAHCLRLTSLSMPSLLQNSKLDAVSPPPLSLPPSPSCSPPPYLSLCPHRRPLRPSAGFAAAHLSCLALVGMAVDAGPAYQVGMLAAAAHLAWQVGSVHLDDPRDCMRKFASNAGYGGLVFAAILADKALSF